MFQSSAATLYGVPIKDSQISLSRAAFVLFLLALGLPKRSLASSPQSSSDSDGNSMPSHLWDTMLHVCEIVFYWLLAIIAKTIQTHPLCPNLIGRSGGPSNHIDMVRLCLQFKLNRFVDIWLDGPSDHELRAHPLCPVDHFVVHWTIQSDCNGQLDHPIRLSWGTWTLDLSCFIQIWLVGPVDHGSTCSWSSGPRLDWLVVQWTTARLARGPVDHPIRLSPGKADYRDSQASLAGPQIVANGREKSQVGQTAQSPHVQQNAHPWPSNVGFAHVSQYCLPVVQMVGLLNNQPLWSIFQASDCFFSSTFHTIRARWQRSRRSHFQSPLLLCIRRQSEGWSPDGWTVTKQRESSQMQRKLVSFIPTKWLPSQHLRNTELFWSTSVWLWRLERKRRPVHPSPSNNLLLGI